MQKLDNTDNHNMLSVLNEEKDEIIFVSCRRICNWLKNFCLCVISAERVKERKKINLKVL